MLDLLRYPYTMVEAMLPPHPDVRITTSFGHIAVEATEVHWGIGQTGGSPTRGKEERAIRANVIGGFWVQRNPIPGVVERIDSKCRNNSYLIDDDEDLWLLLLGGSPAAPASTFIFTPFLNLVELNALTHTTLQSSRFSCCYLFCELTERGRALYGWERKSSWRRII
jgi:hypothetical protein